MANNMRIIDADGHVVEPLNIWEQYLEKEYRPLAPQLVRDENGYERIQVEGKIIGRTVGAFSLGAAMVPGDLSRFDEETRKRFPYANAQPGGFDPHLRIKDMDLEGIDTAVLYPTVGLFFGGIQDSTLSAAVCRAYNNWLADYCRPYPDRLIGIGAVPLEDVDEAIKEMRRTVTALKFKGVFIRPNPYRGRNLDHPDYNPFWAAAQELNTVVAIHEGTTGMMPTAGVERFAYFTEPGPLHFFAHIVSHSFEQKLACLTVVCGGILERFPKLKVAFLESGGGWIAHWLERMDGHYGRLAFEVPWLKHKPSEYFKRNCYVSFDPDEETLAAMAELVSEDSLVWASDYPHFDATFPGAVACIRDRKDLSASAKRKILGENAARLYNLV